MSTDSICDKKDGLGRKVGNFFEHYREAEKIPSASPRRVVMLYSWNFQPYEGWYRRVYNEAKTLVDAGCNVTLLAWDRECCCATEEILDGIIIKRFRIPAGVNQGPKNAWKHLKYSRAVQAYLNCHDFDVVHCFNVDTMPGGLLAAKRHRKKAVLDLCEPDYYRGFWPSRYNWLLPVVNWLEKTLAKRFDHLFVHNTCQTKKFRSYGISRMTQVGSYPNRSMFATDVGRDRGDTVVIGRLGTIYANNGYEELVAAFQQLLARQSKLGKGLQYKLRFAGNVFDTYQSVFESLIKPLGYNVQVTGAYDVSELPQLYREIDISILLYGGESFGNVTPTKLFESMACGVPIVANAIGDVAQILTEGNCGVIVDHNDPQSICEGIEKLASNPELRWTMAANALKLAREKYTWEAVQSDFLSAYHRLWNLDK
jgi:glycosyltransferase involved in cell wall biosynthesis